jgi:hypothetical protein
VTPTEVENLSFLNDNFKIHKENDNNVARKSVSPERCEDCEEEETTESDFQY